VVIKNKIAMDDRKPPAKRRKTGKPTAPKDRFQCPACDKIFDTELGMTRHLSRSPKCCASIFLSHQHKTLSEIQDTKQLRQGNRNLNAELELAAPEEPTNEDENFVNFEDSEDLEDEHRAVEQDEKKNAEYLCYLTNDLVEIDLLKILHDSNSPHYLFKEILEWGKGPLISNMISTLNKRIENQ
jgi:predicted  nucleic acid-binding Zn-ribbon protein